MAVNRYGYRRICVLAHILTVYVRDPVPSVSTLFSWHHFCYWTWRFLCFPDFFLTTVSARLMAVRPRDPLIFVSCPCPSTEVWGIMWLYLAFYVGLGETDSGPHVHAMSVLNHWTISWAFVCDTFWRSGRKNGTGYDKLLRHTGYLAV